MISNQFSPPLLPSSCPTPPWLLLSETARWRHLYRVFTYTYSVMIEKDICDCQNVSVKLPFVYVCFAFGDFFIFW